MDSLRRKWKQTHPHVRKPVVLVVGLIFIVAAGLTGWLPGPGGIPLFLIGIAILATEFEWAERIRDRILRWLHVAGVWFKAHKPLGITLIALSAGLTASLFYLFYIR